METQKLNSTQAIATIKKIILNGGPVENEYWEFEESIHTLAAGMEPGVYESEVAGLLASCDFLFDKDSIMGHIRSKPYGYAGDFEIIDRIYQQEIINEDYRTWDIYSLNHPAAQAVRNRKRYFKKLMSDKFSDTNQLRMLNAASGPARDLYETFLEKEEDRHLEVTCVEMDANAISFASKLNAPFLDNISFINKNIFRFETSVQYDVVWSAGLFDYFDDRAFVLLLKKFGKWTKSGGEVIIGNFNDEHNPSRVFMEVFGEWHLNHRSPEKLINLALQAGFMPEQISVGKEPENINLFLHIRI